MGDRWVNTRHRGSRGAIALAVAAAMVLALTPGTALGGWWRYMEPELVSVSPQGYPGDSSSYQPSISFDGRYVAFDSYASNLSPDDANISGDGDLDVFIRDRALSTTLLVSETPSGAVEPDRGARSAAIDNSGQYVALFTGRDMIAEDTNGGQDLYVRDMETGEYALLDALGDGSALGNSIDNVYMSGDGQHVMFDSENADLVPEDTNGRSDVYVWSWETNELVWASETPTSAVVTGRGARNAGISDDGRYVGIFTGRDMVPADTNGSQDLYIRDMETGEYTYVDLMGDGSSPGDGLYGFQMTGDGAFIVFESDADLALDDDNGRKDVYVWSVADEELIWVSETPEGAVEFDRGARSGTISDDGTRVAFFSGRDHVADDTNGAQDIYIRDMTTGEFERVIVTTDGSSPGDEVDDLVISGNGEWLVFSWEAQGMKRLLGPAFYDPSGTGEVSPSFAVSDYQQVYVVGLESPLEPGSTRISGDTRYSTAIAVSQDAFPNGADTVVLATGEDWPDALCASALSGAVVGPVLLTGPDAIPEEVAAEIERLGARYVYIVGGTGAVSGAVEDELYDLVDGYVFRLAGADRYATSRAVAARVIDILGETYSGEALVATGGNYPDALAGAPLAAGLDRPVLLTRPDSVYLPSDTTGVMILGGTGAVSPAVEAYIEGKLGADAVERVGGANRYETAAMIAQAGVDAGLMWNGVGIASGESFPDALAGGSAAGLQRSVMLLTTPDVLNTHTGAALDANKAEIQAVRFFGGTGALSAAVASAVSTILGM